MKANKELTTKVKKELTDNNGQPVEDDNIDKVRDILFGVQVREFEKRFSKLEAKFEKELDSLRDDTRDRLNKLEEHTSKEANTLTDKIFQEQDLRGDAIKKLAGENQASARDLEKQIGKLGETTAKNESDIRTQILDQSKTFSDNLQKKQVEIMSALEKESKELQDDKTDRAALADLFTEMAMRLSGDFKLPKSK